MFTVLALGMQRFISDLELSSLTVAGTHQISTAQSPAKGMEEVWWLFLSYFCSLRKYS